MITTFILIIVRFLVIVKLISWVILRQITEIPHPISEIEVFLVYILVDIWLFNNKTSMIIVGKDDSKTEEP